MADDPYETLLAFAEDFNERLSAYEGLIQAVSLERGIRHRIPIAVDEWGMMRLPPGLRRNEPVSLTRDKFGVMRLPFEHQDVRHREGKMIINLEDALVTALYLNAFIRHAYSVRMANFTPMPSFMGMINPARPDDPVLLPAIFYPFELYRRTCGQLALDVYWNSDTFSGTYKNRTYAGIRTLDVAATLDEGRKQLVVYVVNQSKNEALETTIDLNGGEFAGNVQKSIVNGSDLKAENTVENPYLTGCEEIAIKTSGKSLTDTFQPHSVTVLACDIR